MSHDVMMTIFEWWQNSGLIALWVVIVARVPQVIANPRQRPLWAAVALIGFVKIFGLPLLYPTLAHVFGSVFTLDVARQTFDVLSATFVLYFLLVATGHTRLWPVLFGSGLAVLIAMYAIQFSAPPHPRSTVGVPQIPQVYWLLLFGFGLAAYTCITVTSWWCVRQTPHRMMKAALLLFGTATAVTAVVYFQYLLVVTIGTGLAPASGDALAGITGWCLALASALPLVTALNRLAREFLTYRRLGPLWRMMYAAAPHIALEEPRSRVRSLTDATALQMRLYRRVIEIRDGLLVLRSHVTREMLDQAAARAGDAPDGERDLVVTALWIEAARRTKLAGAPPGDQTVEADLLPARWNADSIDAEAEWLVRLAKALRSPTVASFADHQTTPHA
jgi:hypothetical protein